MKFAALSSRFLKQLLPVVEVETFIGIHFELVNDGLIHLQHGSSFSRFQIRRIKSFPPQRVHRERADLLRVDAAAPERFDKSDAIVVTVVADEIKIGGDQSAEILAKRDVYGRHIVERAD